MPLFITQYSHSDQFLRDQNGLLEQMTAVVHHVLGNGVSGFPSLSTLTLTDWVDWGGGGLL